VILTYGVIACGGKKINLKMIKLHGRGIKFQPEFHMRRDENVKSFTNIYVVHLPLSCLGPLFWKVKALEEQNFVSLEQEAVLQTVACPQNGTNMSPVSRLTWAIYHRWVCWASPTHVLRPWAFQRSF
jgi:hypothetical protein